MQAGSDAVYCHHRRAELGLIHKHAVILFELRGHRPFGIVKIFPNGRWHYPAITVRARDMLGLRALVALRDVGLDPLVYVWDPRVGFGHGGTDGSGRPPAG